MEREAATLDLVALSREGMIPRGFGRRKRRTATATQGARNKSAKNMSQLIAQTQQGGRSKRVKKEKQERVRTFKTAQAVKLAALFPGTRAVAAAAAPGAGASPNTAHISATTDTCTASIGAPTSGAGKSDNRRMTSVQAVLPNRKKITFPYGIVAAPMVGASDLAFRLLCRRHGVQLCYSEMLHSDRVADPEKGDDYLHTYVLQL